ncbi:MAG: PAS domain-containing protein [Ectobacillus sp.]
MICTIANNGTIQYISPSFANKFGHTNYAPGTKVYTLIHPDDYEYAKAQFLKLVADRKAFEANIRLRKADNEWALTAVKAIPLLNDKGKLQTVLVYPDIGQLNKDNKTITEEQAVQYDNVNILLWSMDLARGINSISGNCEEMFGFTKEDFQENPFVWKRFIHPDDLLKVNETEKKVSLNQITTYEYKAVHPSGEIKWIQTKVIPVTDSFGNINRIDGISIDITDQREDKADGSLQHEHSLHNELILTIDANGIITSISSLEKTQGNFQKTILKKPFLSLFNHNQKLNISKYFNEAIAGNTQAFQTFFPTKSGIVYKLNITALPIELSGEVKTILCRIRYKNIYKETKKRLQINEETISGLVNNPFVGVWHSNLAVQKMIVSRGIETISGYSAKEFLADPLLWRKKICPNDLEGLKNNEESILSGIPVKHHYRIITSTGQVKWVKEIILSTIDPHGKIIFLEGIVIDITPKGAKHVFPQIEMPSSTDRDGETAFVNVDLHGKLTTVSSGAIKLSGYAETELLSMSFLDLLPAEEKLRVTQFFKNTILHGDDIQNRIITMIRKDGSPLKLNVIGLPMLKDGEITGLYVIANDLSPPLQLKEKLLQSKQDFYEKYNAIDLGILLSGYDHTQENPKIIEANSYVCKLLNYSYEELSNTSLDQFILPKNNPIKAFFHSKREYINIRSVLLSKDGKKLPVHLYNHLTCWDNQQVILTIIKQIDEHQDLKELQEDVGQQLRILMAEMNINTAELAQLTGLTAATISNLRTGKVKKPNIDTARKIADALGVGITRIWPGLAY